jgi:hypothetical protein
MGSNLLSELANGKILIDGKKKGKIEGRWLDCNKQIFITATNKLVIGPYDPLATFATGLRMNLVAQQELSNKGARFGRRDTDKIPSRPLIKGGYKKLIKGKATDGDPKEYMEEFMKRPAGTGNGENRLTDLYTDAKKYFQSITLESHHIVEKWMLGLLGKNKGDLQDRIAPCVLVSGELHRRFYSSEGTKFRNRRDLKEAEIRKFYEQELYNSPAFEDLRLIAHIIIEQAFNPTTSKKPQNIS